MLVFVKKSLESDVSGLETSARGIGLMGFGVSAPDLLLFLEISRKLIARATKQ